MPGCPVSVHMSFRGTNSDDAWCDVGRLDGGGTKMSSSENSPVHCSPWGVADAAPLPKMAAAAAAASLLLQPLGADEGEAPDELLLLLLPGSW